MSLPDLPAGLQGKCDTILARLMEVLAAKQVTYRLRYGCYWQGARTHVTLPADGLETAPDRTVKVLYQADSWSSLRIALPSLMPLAVEVHVYDGPTGCGFALIGTVEIAGRAWRKAVSIGPEIWREQDWTDVTPERV